MFWKTEDTEEEINLLDASKEIHEKKKTGKGIDLRELMTNHDNHDQVFVDQFNTYFKVMNGGLFYCHNLNNDNWEHCNLCEDAFYKEFIRYVTDAEYKEYIADLIKDGYITENGAPLKCECGCTGFENINEYMEDGRITEHQVKCTNCDTIVGHWAYGHWDFNII